MTEVCVPLYSRSVWLWRSVFLWVIVLLLQCSWFLPMEYFVLLEIFALGLGFKAVFYLYEFFRLNHFTSCGLTSHGFWVQHDAIQKVIPYNEIRFTFLYYSSLDKMKGSATFCLQLKDGRLYRFAGIQQVDDLLVQWADFQERAM